MLVFWVLFHVFVLGMLVLDLKVFHKKGRGTSLRSCIWICLFWIGLALGFDALVGYGFGWDQALTFFTAYLLEASLSVDNLFLFLSIFAFLKIPKGYQHRVLFWGVLGAFACRIVFILAGIALLGAFHWMYPIFGVILCISAIALYRQGNKEREWQDNWMVCLAKKSLRLTTELSDGKFFIRKNGKRYGTPLLLALILIECSDILFAVDSVPAVLSLTSDPFLAYTSNVFAVLGLRSFYFLLLILHKKFTFLKQAIICILFFIGVKMVLQPVVSFSSGASLIIIAAILTVFAIFFRNRSTA